MAETCRAQASPACLLDLADEWERTERLTGSQALFQGENELSVLRQHKPGAPLLDGRQSVKGRSYVPAYLAGMLGPAAQRSPCERPSVTRSHRRHVNVAQHGPDDIIGERAAVVRAIP